MEEKREWFEDWFDSEWYDKLYSNHDQEEASTFIQNLLTKLNPDTDSHFLDLACGAGRHSVYLNSLGYRVTGLDLSKRKIRKAHQYENDRLSFRTHDMREVFKENEFDFVLNLFTSFGYFEDLEDHLKTLRSIHSQLKEGGTLVIDYLNAKYVERQLPNEEHINRNGVEFDIYKERVKNCVVKTIKIPAEDLRFQERVRLFTLEDFVVMLESSGFEIQTIYGSYRLEPFESVTSERLILIVDKN